MPNQYNFRSDVTTKTEPTYIASRIVRFPEEDVLFEELPASFGYDTEDNIEIHFYTTIGNRLIFSALVNATDAFTGVLKSHIVSFEDGTYRNYIRIDLTKLFDIKGYVLVPGDYRMVMNFFSDEIGSYTNKVLSITSVNEERNQVQLDFNNGTNPDTITSNLLVLREFVLKSFQKPDAVGTAEKIFKSGVELNDSTEGLTSTNIIENLEIVQGQRFDNTIERMERLNLLPVFEEQLNDFVVKLYDTLREKMVTQGDERIQEGEFQTFIRNTVSEQIVNLRQTVDQRIKIR